MEDLEKLKVKLVALSGAASEVNKIIDSISKSCQSAFNSVKVAESELSRIKDKTIEQSNKIRNERESFESYHTKTLEELAKFKITLEDKSADLSRKIRKAEMDQVELDQKRIASENETKKLKEARQVYESKLAKMKDSIASFQ